MKHVRNYESHKKLNNPITETVVVMDDTFSIITPVTVSKSFINSYVKKVKDAGIDLRSIMGDQTIAEELVKYVQKGLTDVDKIPANALTGGPDPQVQVQAQIEPQAQTQVQPQVQAQVQPQVQVQAQPQAVQDAVQDAVDAVQAQPQAQPQGQAQDQEGFSDIQDDEEAQDEVQNANNELPI